MSPVIRTLFRADIMVQVYIPVTELKFLLGTSSSSLVSRSSIIVLQTKKACSACNIKVCAGM